MLVKATLDNGGLGDSRGERRQPRATPYEVKVRPCHQGYALWATSGGQGGVCRLAGNCHTVSVCEATRVTAQRRECSPRGVELGVGGGSGTWRGMLGEAANVHATAWPPVP